MTEEIAVHPITEYLTGEWRFQKAYPRLREIDYNKYTCFLRIHALHYLYWSESYKYFSLVVVHEEPKGKAGGGIELSTDVMIPKPIYSVDDAKALLEGIVDKKHLHLYL